MLDQLVIGVRRAHLEAVSHAHAVPILQHVARKERLQLDEAQPVDDVVARGAFEQPFEEPLRWRRLTQPLLGVRGKERCTRRRIEVGDPRQVRPLEALHRCERELARTAEAVTPARRFRKRTRAGRGERANRTGNAPVPRRCREPAEAGIAGEELVRAVSGERDLHVLTRQAREFVDEQRGRVPERLVEVPDDLGEQRLRIGACLQLVVRGSERRGDETRVVALVVQALFGPREDAIRKVESR